MRWLFFTYLIVPLALSVTVGCKQNRSAASKPAPVPLLVDLNSVALKPRATVERILGKPMKYTRRSKGEIGDTATYAWGEVNYANNHLVGLRRVGPPKPYEAALAELRLPTTSVPYVREVDQNLIWADQPFGTGIRSPQGLSIMTAFIAGDFSEFDIWILDTDSPGSWTDDQCLMWLHLSGAPVPEKALHRGNPLYWPFHHDGTDQECKSQS